MNDSELILRAAQFAALKHRDQRRKDAESSPYVIHPISVACAIAEIGGVDGAEILAAALLHDTLEDTETTREELIEEFGEKVCCYVEEVTDDKSLPKAVRKEKQIEHAASLSEEAVLIKLGDKITNVTDVINNPPIDWDTDQRKQYLDWAESVINNTPKTDSPLLEHFKLLLEKGRMILV